MLWTLATPFRLQWLTQLKRIICVVLSWGSIGNFSWLLRLNIIDQEEKPKILNDEIYHEPKLCIIQFSVFTESAITVSKLCHPAPQWGPSRGLNIIAFFADIAVQKVRPKFMYKGNVQQVAYKSFVQKWRSKVMFKSYVQKLYKKVTSKTGIQKWYFNTMSIRDVQNWHTKWIYESGVHKGYMKVIFKRNVLKWCPKVAMSVCRVCATIHTHLEIRFLPYAEFCIFGTFSWSWFNA